MYKIKIIIDLRYLAFELSQASLSSSCVRVWIQARYLKMRVWIQTNKKKR
ncbi:unnamed protein product [Musa banksii]